MKTRLLALLLCLLLVASACLMTACGSKKKNNTETEAPAVEVTDDAARKVAFASFLKAIDAVRKGGVVFNGSLQGTSTEKNGADELETENFNLQLALKYNDEKFDAVATGSEGDLVGTFEAYFDGELFAILSTEDGKTDGSVFFLDDLAAFAAMIPAPGVASLTTMIAEEDDGYTAFVDGLLALVDLDKVAASINSSAKGVVVIKTNGTTYTVSLSSDALFDAVAGIVTILKDSGDKPASELFDALLGEGSFAKLQETLEGIEGTDTLDTVLPVLETALADLGIKVDAVYEFVAPFLGVTGEDAGTQAKATLTGMLSDMTVNDAIDMAFGMFGDMFGGGQKEYGYDEYPPLQSAAPEVGSEGEGEGEGEEGMTYEGLVNMFLTYAAMNVNDLIVVLSDEETFDIAEELAPALDEIAAYKEAFKANVSVTCDATLKPTAIALTVSVDTTKLPAEMVEPGEVTQIELSINAEIKTTVDITPSEAMQAKITAEKAARQPAPAQEGAPEN